jgi:hypothetical protein
VNRLSPRLLGISALAFIASHCGGSTTPDTAGPDGRALGIATPEGGGHDGGPLDDSGLWEGTASPDRAPTVAPEHRATAAACRRSPPIGTPADAVPVVACSSDLDCRGDGSTQGLVCRGGYCDFGADECLVDADCASGSVCVCGNGAFQQPYNTCVAASCRIDADCGRNGYCSPSLGGCGSVVGFHCRTRQDTCVDPTDDCRGGSTWCVYAPTVGHFVCGTQTCNG